MAGVARRPRKKSGMERRICMAGRTRGGQAGEASVGMTAVATETGMRPGQWKDDVVIESGRQPTIGRVASSTGSSEFAGVRIVFGMAGIAIGRRALENVIDMATGARNAGMFSN